MQNGVPPVQALVFPLVHCTQIEPLQTGVEVPLQTVLSVEQSITATHECELGSQTSPFEHWPSFKHCTQVWELVSQTGAVPPQLVLSMHPTQVCELGSQTFPALQSESPAQATQLWVEVSQTGVLPEQVLLSVQATQVLVPVSHFGVLGVAAQSLSAVQAAVQVWLVVSQIGVFGVAEQSFEVTHWTQLSVVRSQTLPLPQLLLSVQPTQVLVLVSQAGVAPEQLLLSVHATQEWVERSHAGVEPEQVLLSMQATQLLVARSQAGVSPEHAGLQAEPASGVSFTTQRELEQTKSEPRLRQSEFTLHSDELQPATAAIIAAAARMRILFDI